MEDNLLCLNEGVELWEGYTPISKETAIMYVNDNKEVYGLDYEGHESLIWELSDLDDFEMFVIHKTEDYKTIILRRYEEE